MIRRYGYWRKITRHAWRCPDGSEIIRETRSWSLYVKVFGSGSEWIGDYDTMRSAREAHAAYRRSMHAPGKQVSIYA